jgi:hypothetical protein
VFQILQIKIRRREKVRGPTEIWEDRNGPAVPIQEIRLLYLIQQPSLCQWRVEIVKICIRGLPAAIDNPALVIQHCTRTIAGRASAISRRSLVTFFAITGDS